MTSCLSLRAKFYIDDLILWSLCLGVRNSFWTWRATYKRRTMSKLSQNMFAPSASKCSLRRITCRGIKAKYECVNLIILTVSGMRAWCTWGWKRCARYVTKNSPIWRSTWKASTQWNQVRGQFCLPASFAVNLSRRSLIWILTTSPSMQSRIQRKNSVTYATSTLQTLHSTKRLSTMGWRTSSVRIVRRVFMTIGS